MVDGAAALVLPYRSRSGCRFSLPFNLSFFARYHPLFGPILSLPLAFRSPSVHPCHNVTCQVTHQRISDRRTGPEMAVTCTSLDTIQ